MVYTKPMVYTKRSHMQKQSAQCFLGMKNRRTYLAYSRAEDTQC